jgi:hypothetical protein
MNQTAAEVTGSANTTTEMAAFAGLECIDWQSNAGTWAVTVSGNSSLD